MNASDWLIVLSVVVLVPALLVRNSAVRDVAVPLSFVCIISAVGFNQNYASLVIFGLIAGSLIQPLWADPYLTRHTLVYEKTPITFPFTPWWMVVLWGVAVVQLSWGWIMWERLLGDSWLSIGLFTIAGWLYFLVFELLVNNHTKWWTRKNCRQIYNVAVYAMLAEAISVFILPFIIRHLITDTFDIHNAGMLGFSYGIAIATTFQFMCWMFRYRTNDH